MIKCGKLLHVIISNKSIYYANKTFPTLLLALWIALSSLLHRSNVKEDLE